MNSTTENTQKKQPFKMPKGPASFADFKKFLNDHDPHGKDVMEFLKQKAPKVHQVALNSNADVRTMSAIVGHKLAQILNIAELYWPAVN